MYVSIEKLFLFFFQIKIKFKIRGSICFNEILGGIIVLNHDDDEPSHQLQLRHQGDNTYFKIVKFDETITNHDT